MSEDFFEASTSKKGKKDRASKAAALPKAEWPSPYKPKLNFMPEHRRRVEYGRRAVRNGVLLVAISLLAVTGTAVTVDGYKSLLQRDMNTLTAEVTDAYNVLQEAEPITKFYANYIDQRQAVSRQFNDELSAGRIFSELDTLSGSSVKVMDVTYDLNDKECLNADPFFEAERTGCVTVTGEANNPAALAGFVDKVNAGSALFTQAQISEANVTNKGMVFTMSAGYTPEAESNRGKQFTPTDDELAKVVKSIPTRSQGEQVSNGK